MTDETRRVISEYLAGCVSKDPRFDESVQRITMMTFLSTPELQWDVILEAVRQAAGDDHLGHVAAGPIEGLLGRHGPAAIGWVEAEAASNRKFARALTGVWKYTIPDVIWERVKAAKDAVPLDEWLPAGLKERAKRPPA